jgi:hypothetical protein
MQQRGDVMSSIGRWRGYWEQLGWGRQVMDDLTLRFTGGLISGEGHDIIGRFHFQGTVAAGGKVHLVKQYVGRHQVLYEGNYDGEGTIFGTWSIGTIWSGPFVLTTDRQAAPAEESIRELKVAGVPR